MRGSVQDVAVRAPCQTSFAAPPRILYEERYARLWRHALPALPGDALCAPERRHTSAAIMRKRAKENTIFRLLAMRRFKICFMFFLGHSAYKRVRKDSQRYGDATR